MLHFHLTVINVKIFLRGGMKVRAIIFDLDDTLYDPMQPFNQAYQKHLPQMAAKVSVSQFYLKSRAISDFCLKSSS